MKAKVVNKGALKAHQTNNRSIIAPSGIYLRAGIGTILLGNFSFPWPVAAVS